MTKYGFILGLELLLILLKFVESNLKAKSTLTPSQQLLMTPMRMRLNLSGQDLLTTLRYIIPLSVASFCIFA